MHHSNSLEIVHSVNHTACAVCKQASKQVNALKSLVFFQGEQAFRARQELQ